MSTPDRLPVFTAWPDGFEAMLALESTIASTDLEPGLIELVKYRASQINRCHYCMQMHYDAAVRAGVDRTRLETLAGWPDHEGFNAGQRAALALTDALTEPAGAVPDDLFDEATQHYTTAQITQLVFVIATINAWNRLAIAGNLAPARR